MACMDHLVIRRSNSVGDLEIGETSSEDDEIKMLGSSGEIAYKHGRLRSESASTIGMNFRSGDGSSSSEGTFSSSENLEIIVGEKGESAKISAENGMVKEKRKKRSSKPPLPPRGPSLRMADMKLLREMSELTRLKRARVKRIKATKKKRAENASSSRSNIFPILVTIVFFYVIIFQGNLVFLSTYWVTKMRH